MKLPQKPYSIIAGVESPSRPKATYEFLDALVRGLDTAGYAGGFVGPVALDKVEHDIIFAMEFRQWRRKRPLGPEDRQRLTLYDAVRAAALEVLARPLSDFEEGDRAR